MPVTKFKTPEKYLYLNGFGSYHESEALEGALPVAQNTPQKPPYGLYTEKISGSPFAAERPENQQTWIYRMVPAAAHQPFVPQNTDAGPRGLNQKLHFTPTQVRWDPFDLDEEADWVHSMHLLAGAGDVAARSGLGYFIFTAGKSMDPKSAFYTSDGHLLIIPQHGVLDIRTELGRLLVRPHEICVIPAGIRYNVALPEGPVRGYALELYQGHFTLPNLGPMGSFGLANARDFQIPRADFDEESSGTYRILAKFNNDIHIAEQDHSPFDVVAWHGQYYPYKYDLGRFLTIGSISYDHPDPSIFSLLASSEGVFEMAIFPPRWLVMEDTFRPPWYHRNTMAEFMGLITGEYDARTDGGFRPGGASLHNAMTGHGPDSETHKKASVAELTPQKVGEGSMAFVIESSMILGLSEWAFKTSQKRQLNYNSQTWGGLKSHFKMPEGAVKKSSLLKDAQAKHTNGSQ
ncbi:Homogentisate 1,2-dioxygenase [Xylogone sp. PMI_703]|nr:Homogentisate 1,2-dioxygenase [Xylogone sp. PMI_703]